MNTQRKRESEMERKINGSSVIYVSLLSVSTVDTQEIYICKRVQNVLRIVQHGQQRPRLRLQCHTNVYRIEQQLRCI